MTTPCPHTARQPPACRRTHWRPGCSGSSIRSPPPSRPLRPLLCHTADEAFRALNRTDPADADGCVHLRTLLSPSGTVASPAWEKMFSILPAAQLALERAKAPTADGGIGVENPLDAGVILPDSDKAFAPFDSADLADLLGVRSEEHTS